MLPIFVFQMTFSGRLVRNEGRAERGEIERCRRHKQLLKLVQIISFTNMLFLRVKSCLGGAGRHSFASSHIKILKFLFRSRYSVGKWNDLSVNKSFFSDQYHSYLGNFFPFQLNTFMFAGEKKNF